MSRHHARDHDEVTKIHLTRYLGRIFLLVFGLKPLVYQLYAMNMRIQAGARGMSITTLDWLVAMLEVGSALLLLVFGWLLLDRLCKLCENTAALRTLQEGKSESDPPSII